MLVTGGETMLGTDRVLRMNIPKQKSIALQGLKPSITKTVVACLFGGPATAFAVAKYVTDSRYEAAISGSGLRDFHICSRDTAVRHLDRLVKVGKVERSYNTRGNAVYRLKLK
jgi:hypothetical protein